MPPPRTTPSGYARGRQLRHELTPAERTLWPYLRGLREQGVHFRRQHAIGPYVADFCAPRHQLIVEVDGSQHIDQHERDDERTGYLKSQGYRVLRFWNSQVMNDMDGVMRTILQALK